MAVLDGKSILRQTLVLSWTSLLSVRPKERCWKDWKETPERLEMWSLIKTGAPSLLTSS